MYLNERIFCSNAANKKIWEFFYEEIKICSLASMEYEIIPDQIRLSQNENSLKPQIYNNYLSKLQKMLINASDWLGDCDIQFKVPTKYLKTKTTN